MEFMYLALCLDRREKAWAKRSISLNSTFDC